MKKLGLLVILCSLTSQAFAGLLIDPYIGTGSYVGSFDAASSGTDDPDDIEESMTAMGSRLGYSFLLFSGGIDYQLASVDDETVNNISAFVGVDLPILFRFWGEYFLSSDFDNDKLDSVDFSEGYGLGIGFTGLPFVSLNLEAQYLNYDAKVSGNKFDYETASYLLSVSLPIDL